MKSTPILMSGPLVRAVLSGLKTQTRRPIERIAKIGPVTEFQRSDTRGYDWIMRDQRKLWNDLTHAELLARCPYGSVGDRLWVRETWKIGSWKPDGRLALDYRAGPIGKTPWIQPPPEAFEKLIGESFSDCEKGHKLDPERVRDEGSEWKWDVGESPCRWRPSILMPRWACRLELEITDIRAQRLHDISEEDAQAEGILSPDVHAAMTNVLENASDNGRFYRVAFERAWKEIYGPESWTSDPWVWALTFKRVHQ